VLHGARADDRGGDRRVAQHERERHVDQRQAGLLGQLGERLGCVELALVGGDREVVAPGHHRRAARGEVVGALAPPA
jgi:hypothetical protein